MVSLMQGIVTLFGFTVHQELIAGVCVIWLLVYFMGGLIRSTALAFGGPIRDRKLTATTSFRLVLAGMIILGIFAAYYHGFLTSQVTLSQIIYWVFTVLAAPLFAVIGS